MFELFYFAKLGLKRLQMKTIEFFSSSSWQSNETNEVAKNIYSVMDQVAVGVRKCQRWFKIFLERNFSLKDESRQDRVSHV